MQGFNDLSELAPETVEHLLSLAKRLEEHPEPRALEGKVLALLFLSPSLRTQTSFQAAMLRLVGGVGELDPDDVTARIRIGLGFEVGGHGVG